MFLKYMFHQYNNRTGPTFGSRFMKACGQLVLGKPEAKGFEHLRKDLQDTYYYIKEDRHLPTEVKALQQWEIQSLFLAQFREVEAPLVSKATFLFLLPLVFLCVLGAASISATQASYDKATSKSPGKSEVTEAPGLANASAVEAKRALTIEDCYAMSQQIETGLTTIETIPDYTAKKKECTRLQNLTENN